MYRIKLTKGDKTRLAARYQYRKRAIRAYRRLIAYYEPQGYLVTISAERGDRKIRLGAL